MNFQILSPVKLITIAALTVAALPASAQNDQRRATFRNDGDPARGKCTIEVVVDGVAEIEIRGDNGVIRNLAGQPAQWRRFECNGPLPANPVNFRFAGVDGRGSQQLVRDPRSGGSAVVRIEDRPSGAEGYTFDLFWENGGGRGPVTAVPIPQDRFPRGDRGDQTRGGFGRPFAADDAVRVCRESIAQQAGERFRTRDIQFRRIAMDDNPGRNDWVVGTIVVGSRDGDQPLRFSCSVDFQSGRVRSAEIEPGGMDRNAPTGGLNRDMQACQRATEQRLRTDGYDRIQFRSINAEARPEGPGRIVGVAAGYRRDFADSFDFSCVVDPRDGDVRVDVRRR
jgi:hypothetical protein